MQITIEIATLEPGTHISRKTVGRRPFKVVELPLASCQEKRPDWGEYKPVTTFPKIERSLRAAGHLPHDLGRDEQYRFWISRKEEATA